MKAPKPQTAVGCRAEIRSREILQPDDPVTFAEAAEILLRGLVTASTLEIAAKRGELETERLGRRIVTTPAMVRRWRKRFSVPAKSDHNA